MDNNKKKSEPDEEAAPQSHLELTKTGVSQAFWCDTSDTIVEFVPAEISFDGSKDKSLSWFDHLFEGGIYLPNGVGDSIRPLTMLVSGPPGSGKTTLISELCYRLAINEQKNPKSLSTLYISTDADTDRMINNAVNYGWPDASDYFIAFDQKEKTKKLNQQIKSLIGVWGREKFSQDNNKKEILFQTISVAVSTLSSWLLRDSNTTENLLKHFGSNIKNSPIREATGGSKKNDTKEYIPDILVIDSLNILNPDVQGEYFEAFVNACRATKLVIFMLNTGGENGNHKFWEYYCDIVLQLDHEYEHDYYVRTIEVVKARYQSHRWGKHQLKIYPNPKVPSTPSEDNAEACKAYNTIMKRAHPYRKTGGVFIFPSIHSYLSVYKRKTNQEPTARVETYPAKLNDVFRIPKGRCTAFIGERGGHKSHLGYLHVLNRLLNFKHESGLIVSMLEDESITKNTLETIMQDEFPNSMVTLDDLETRNQFEVLYFPPGYITPEEFFHRVFISVHRLKKNKNSVTVMFNSLDQISARFPLCAKQEIFIPGLIQSLSGEDVTSICIAVDEPGQPVQQYGLLPMADLIVKFSMRQFTAQEYYSQIYSGWQKDFSQNSEHNSKFEELQREASGKPLQTHESVVLQVVRFSGGLRAGKRGMLELVSKAELAKFPYPGAGLHFTPMDEQLAQGELISEKC